MTLKHSTELCENFSAIAYLAVRKFNEGGSLVCQIRIHCYTVSVPFVAGMLPTSITFPVGEVPLPKVMGHFIRHQPVTLHTFWI